MYASNDHHNASTSNAPWNRSKLTGQTRQAIDQHLSKSGSSENGYLFPGRKIRSSHLTTRQINNGSITPTLPLNFAKVYSSPT